jgi:hypothetical protein
MAAEDACKFALSETLDVYFNELDWTGSEDSAKLFVPSNCEVSFCESDESIEEVAVKPAVNKILDVSFNKFVGTRSLLRANSLDGLKIKDSVGDWVGFGFGFGEFETVSGFVNEMVEIGL